jgi:hypothetical protein
VTMTAKEVVAGVGRLSSAMAARGMVCVVCDWNASRGRAIVDQTAQDPQTGRFPAIQRRKANTMAQFNGVCSVLGAGTDPNGDVRVCLSDAAGSFQKLWFTASAPREREMLATALASITSSLKVWAEVVEPEEGAKLVTLYITR